MKICIAGKNEISICGLKLALQTFRPDEIVICPNQGDDGVSRWQPSLIRYAKEWNVRVCSLSDLYEIKDLVFISLEFDRIVRPERFNSKFLYNIHFSMLPAYKGMYTSAWPILNGQNSTGVTLHEIDHGIDTGNIIAQKVINFNIKDTARSLYYLYMEFGKKLLSEYFDDLLNRRFSSIKQSAVGSSYYSKASINYSDLNLDINNTAESIVRQCQAFHFREFQIPTISNVEISYGKILPIRSKQRPGTVFFDKSHIIVSSVDYDVMFERDCSFDVFKMLESNNIDGVTELNNDLLNVTNQNGWTALMIAAYHGNRDFCCSLIQAGANVEKANQNGTTPLMYAKEYGVKTGDFSIADILIDAGADVLTIDMFGQNVIDYSKINAENSAIAYFGGY